MLLTLISFTACFLYIMLLLWSRYAWSKAASEASDHEPIFISVIMAGGPLQSPARRSPHCGR